MRQFVMLLLAILIQGPSPPVQAGENFLSEWQSSTTQYPGGTTTEQYLTNTPGTPSMGHLAVATTNLGPPGTPIADGALSAEATPIAGTPVAVDKSSDQVRGTISTDFRILGTNTGGTIPYGLVRLCDEHSRTNPSYNTNLLRDLRRAYSQFGYSLAYHE